MLMILMVWGILKGTIWDNTTRVTQSNPFVPQAVRLRSGKVSIPAARPNQVPAGRPTPVSIGRPKPVSTGKQNRPPPVHASRRNSSLVNLHTDTGDEGIVNSGCSRSMTGNKERLDDFQPFRGGKVTFGGGEGRITRKGTIRTPKLNFENVYYVKELQQFNLFSVSQICGKNNRVLFTDTDCLVLSNDFKLPDESMVLLKVPRKHNLYKGHRRMAHMNYKNMNKLVQDNLVRGLPPKLFKHDHTCVACCKGKQHKATYKVITDVSSIFEPFQLLHMDLFGPTSIRSIDHKFYCLVITDDFSRFCWVFFLETKDVTYPILKDFISLVENQLNKKSNARTLQQNGVAERKNKTLIEAARTMLADSELATMFWTEAVSTACYVLNRVLITNPHNKIPYALLTGKIPSISHFKPFGCHVTILNTSDHLGKFDGKANEGYLVGYSTSYNRDKANQSAGTQDVSFNPASLQDDDLNSDSDEQVILVPSYPSNNIPGVETKDTSNAHSNGVLFDTAKDIFQR
ncbi:putative ribonuclease H-like domain-containing protein, partial [Tanacetum coccineum]